MKPFQFEGQEVVMNLKHKDLHIDLTLAPPFDPKVMDPSHPFYMLLKLKKSTEAYLNAITELLSGLPKGLEVLEFCGGVGLVAESVWNIIEPKKWFAVEFDPACVVTAIPRRTNYQIMQGDMYEPDWLTWWEPEGDDLIHMDWPTNTLRKFWDEPRVSEFMDRVVSKRPRYIGITDIECGWIHLPNHWPIYKHLFAEIGFTTRPSTQTLRDFYSHIYDRYIRDRWEYKMIRRTLGGGGEYFLLEAM